MGLTITKTGIMRDIEERMRDLRANLRPEAAKRVAAAFGKRVHDQFRQSKDPYGRPWKPVFRNRRRDRRARASGGVRADRPLVDTGRMRASVIARADGTTVRVAIPVEYASYHQRGTRFIARRQILPERATGGLPPAWLLDARREILAVMLKMLKE